MVVCAGACVCGVCVCVCACVHACVRACVRACMCACMLRIVSLDKILHFLKSFIIIMCCNQTRQITVHLKSGVRLKSSFIPVVNTVSQGHNEKEVARHWAAAATVQSTVTS